ncbi:MAG: hypothetical protein ACQCN6_01850 [Candidatus Bathyarchaeia archaeon]
MIDRVIIASADYPLGAVIIQDGVACTVASKVPCRRGWRYGLTQTEAPQ